MRTLRLIAACLVTLLPPTAPASILISQTADIGSPADDVFRIVGAKTDGTGELIAEKKTGDLLSLILATNDHVLRGNVLTAIGFRSDRAPVQGTDNSADHFDLNVGKQLAIAQTQLGPVDKNVRAGGSDKLVDLALLAVSVDLTKLTAKQQALLMGLAPLDIGTVAPDDVPLDFRSYGYGDSATPPRGKRNGEGTYDYVYHFDADTWPDQQYGILRYENNRIDKLDTVRDRNTYEYLGAVFAFDGPFSKNAVDGEGYPFPGDSGGPMMADGKLVGLISGGRYERFNCGDSRCLGVNYGQTAIGVPMVTAYRDWLVSQRDALNAPEPATWIPCMVTVIALGLRRRRRARLKVVHTRP